MEIAFYLQGLGWKTTITAHFYEHSRSFKQVHVFISLPSNLDHFTALWELSMKAFPCLEMATTNAMNRPIVPNSLQQTPYLKEKERPPSKCSAFLFILFHISIIWVKLSFKTLQTWSFEGKPEHSISWDGGFFFPTKLFLPESIMTLKAVSLKKKKKKLLFAVYSEVKFI